MQRSAGCGTVHLVLERTRLLERCFGLLVGLGFAASCGATPIVIGSKVFTESVILGEVATQFLRSSGQDAQHRRELGGTRVLWSAMLRGDIDCYSEYSGTLAAEIFAPNQSLLPAR